jgi:hypothetical protein
MRIPRSMLLGVALIVPQLGGAQLPIPTDAFAKFEGVLDFCAKANPKDSDKYDKLRKDLVKGAPEKEVSDLRATQQYKDAYLEAKSEFTKMPKEKAIETCSASLGDSK